MPKGLAVRFEHPEKTTEEQVAVSSFFTAVLFDRRASFPSS